MKKRFRVFRVLFVSFAIVLLGLGGIIFWFVRPWLHEISPWGRVVSKVESYSDIRWMNARSADLRGGDALLPTLRFNLRTRWPKAENMPPSSSPGQLLTNAMNPGLGIRELHRAGINGDGVHVAIIDYSIEGEHPEYASQVVEIHRVGGAHSPTMHGPAVASLLVGAHCGTAPRARLHFVVVADGVADANNYADGLDWIITRNKGVPDTEKIRAVSISASPSERGAHHFRNGEKYDAAVERAEAAGILVIDGTEHRGFVGPCNLDPLNPEDPAKCRAIPARGRPNYYEGRVLAPTAPRTTAEEYRRGQNGYQYCGLQKETWYSAGSSWSMPYCTGVLALGWQLHPEMTAKEMKQLLFDSAYVHPSGSKIINPAAFVAAVKKAKPILEESGDQATLTEPLE